MFCFVFVLVVVEGGGPVHLNKINNKKKTKVTGVCMTDNNTILHNYICIQATFNNRMQEFKINY